eukprot:355791-Chlamydomonas_euryale.AAC.2
MYLLLARQENGPSPRRALFTRNCMVDNKRATQRLNESTKPVGGVSAACTPVRHAHTGSLRTHAAWAYWLSGEVSGARAQQLVPFNTTAPVWSTSLAQPVPG